MDPIQGVTSRYQKEITHKDFILDIVKGMIGDFTGRNMYSMKSLLLSSKPVQWPTAGYALRGPKRDARDYKLFMGVMSATSMFLEYNAHEKL